MLFWCKSSCWGRWLCSQLHFSFFNSHKRVQTNDVQHTFRSMQSYISLTGRRWWLHLAFGAILMQIILTQVKWSCLTASSHRFNDYKRICLAYMRLIWPTVAHGWGSSICDDERVWLAIERENFNKSRWNHVAFMLMKWVLTTLLCSILLTIHPQLCPKQAIGCVTGVLWWVIGWKSNQEPAFQPLFPIIPLK